MNIAGTVDEKWKKADINALESESIRPCLTYWQDAWRRLKKILLLS